MEKVLTTIKAKQNLYNGGLCFTKGKTYNVWADTQIHDIRLLQNRFVNNDMNLPHRIGIWWKHFTIES